MSASVRVRDLRTTAAATPALATSATCRRRRRSTARARRRRRSEWPRARRRFSFRGAWPDGRICAGARSMARLSPLRTERAAPRRVRSHRSVLMIRTLILAAAVLALRMPSPALAQERHEVQGFGGVTVGTATHRQRRVADLRRAGQRRPDAERPGDRRGGTARRDRVAAVRRARLHRHRRRHLRVLRRRGRARHHVAGSAVRPYGEATAGFARLNASVSGLNGRTDPIIDTALDLINSTQPMLGAGGGVLIAAGPRRGRHRLPLQEDLRRRHHRGVPRRRPHFTINQVRVGVGLRF